MSKTKNQKLIKWVAEVEAMCKPDKVYWCDGTKAEYDHIMQEAVKTGAAVKL
ncbi:MAG: hypothetical protein JXA66_08865, partial [Oligoflexia bacterium]|nr:hypothetical protein [Oligoflexia bacterium]